MPSTSSSSTDSRRTPFTMDARGHGEAHRFLREHTEVRSIVSLVRERFKAITRLLLEEGINRHDLPHQLRTALYATQFMRRMGFDHDAILATGVAAAIHDFGYLIDVDSAREADVAKEGDEPAAGADLHSVVYNSGTKGLFKQHARIGAEEISNLIHGMLDFINDEKFWKGDPGATAKAEALRQLLSYTDESGEVRLIGPAHIRLITSAILHHNDYGTHEASYSPYAVDKPALVTQLFDKLDNLSSRVYPEHLNPGNFAEGSPDYDDHYFHRSASCCIADYHFSVDPESGTMRVIYEMDPARFTQAMRQNDPEHRYFSEDYEYTEAMLVDDFKKAYTKNMRVAAEGVGVIMDRPVGESNLTVELCFPSGRSVALPFSRPERPIYRDTLVDALEKR